MDIVRSKGPRLMKCHLALPGRSSGVLADFSAILSGSTEAARGGRFCLRTVGGVWPGVVDPGRRGIPELLLLLEDEEDRPLWERGEAIFRPGGGGGNR